MRRGARSCQRRGRRGRCRAAEKPVDDGPALLGVERVAGCRNNGGDGELLAVFAFGGPLGEVVDVVASCRPGSEPQFEVGLGAGGQGEVAGGEPVKEPDGVEDLVAGVSIRGAGGRVGSCLAADTVQDPPCRRTRRRPCGPRDGRCRPRSQR